ncbi:MAG: 2,3,4,5-tetrahydropyridine-2,6-dicarboxylate N-succinyltransferase, partial [Rhodococcus sp.]|nr:2,3,4,5-tetrahydropyridine-2,6-dicarboxylate N-succinyltransferase [Rhodococcus sp. (in: high G+C Gram-positive bacteria)]
MSAQGATAVGIANITTSGVVLDTWFPSPEFGSGLEAGTTRLEGSDIPAELAALVGADEARGVEVVA